MAKHVESYSVSCLDAGSTPASSTEFNPQYSKALRVFIWNHVFLRLKNISTVDIFYSLEGINWNKIESSVEVSALHQNVLSGFLSLRDGLYAIGEVIVKYKNFVYNPIR